MYQSCDNTDNCDDFGHYDCDVKYLYCFISYHAFRVHNSYHLTLRPLVHHLLFETFIHQTTYRAVDLRSDVGVNVSAPCASIEIMP